MATGRDIQLAKQIGEYLVAAEICRLGFIATTFTGNVPHYDIIASNKTGAHQAVQVKAIRGNAWQFDIRTFAKVTLKENRQVVGRAELPIYPDLICVLVVLGGYGGDKFYVMTWEDLQSIAIAHHKEYLKKHGGIRPKKPDSFHMAIRPEMLAAHRDRWDLLKDRLRDSPGRVRASSRSHSDASTPNPAPTRRLTRSKKTS